MKRFAKRMVCCFLLVCIVFAPLGESEAKAVCDSVEVEELRTQNSDTFLLSDGTYECTIYSENKYFLNDEGWYVEIDNQIVEKPVLYGDLKFTYKNREDSVDVCFQEAMPSLLLKTEDWAMALLFNDKDQQFDVIRKGDTITYHSISDEYELSYRCDGRGVSICLGICEGGTGEIWFNVSSDLLFSIDSYGNVIFENETGETVLYLSSPYIEQCDQENNNATAQFVVVETENMKSQLGLLYSMGSSTRNLVDNYPLMICTGAISVQKLSSQDSFVNSGYPNNTYGSANNLRTGTDSDNKSFYTFVSFSIPTGINGSNIYSATLRLHRFPSQSNNGSVSLRAYRVLHSWSESTLTYDNRPTYTTSGCSPIVTTSVNNDFNLDVTQIVTSWVNGSANNRGITIRNTTASTSSHYIYTSYNSTPSGYGPKLIIKYDEPYGVDRMYSKYSDVDPYKNEMQFQMNCYLYALHVFMEPGNTAVDNYPGFISGNGGLPESGLTEAELRQELISRIEADVAKLSASDATAVWTIETLPSRLTSIPAGKREIALVFNTTSGGYHFYVRHSNGVWSHKGGSSPITNKALSNSNVTLTDTNIETYIHDGGYDSQPVYFLINKPFIVDYKLEADTNGYRLRSSSQYGGSDYAGDVISKAQTIGVGTNKCAFDYKGDVDWYVFTAPSTSTYCFHVFAASISGYDCVLAVYSKYGHRLNMDSTGNDLTCYLSCTQGEKYFIVAAAPEDHLSLYTLSISQSTAGT